jgi:NADH-quinone oxidoreductase subunit H
VGEFTNKVLDKLLGVVRVDVAPDSSIGYVIAALIQCILLLHVVAVGALVFIWLERKIAGRIQDRLGPTRVGGAFGWLQTLADGIKLIAKEDVMPKDADPLLFKVAPYVSMGAAFTAYIALPFSNGWVAQHVNSAVFFVIAILGLEVFLRSPARDVRGDSGLHLRHDEFSHDCEHASRFVHELAGLS